MACTVLATVCVLLIVTLQARNAEGALDEAVGHTLRDYTGYAGRILGADVLRRFAEQRATILAPVTGSSRRSVPAPALADIVELGDAYFAQEFATPDSGIGYFRIDGHTGAIEGRGRVSGQIATRLADTLRLVENAGALDAPEVLAIADDAGGLSVAFARLLDQKGTVVAIYGYTYTRSRGIAAIANRAFKETPLLPISVAGPRWNYDTTRVRPNEVVNDSFLGVRIADRGGRVLWASPGTEFMSTSAYREPVVLSTSAGGIVVETALRPSSASLLIPTVVRKAQRWSMGALIGLTILLAAVSLLALRGERAGARARRTEAMQQLALGLRHEINNALASVMLNAELLGEDESLDESQRERLVAIIEQLDRMRSVLRRLEKTDRFDVVVPYLNEGYMVDLST